MASVLLSYLDLLGSLYWWINMTHYADGQIQIENHINEKALVFIEAYDRTHGVWTIVQNRGHGHHVASVFAVYHSANFYLTLKNQKKYPKTQNIIKW